MLFRFRCAWLRLAVGLIAVAAPLVGAGAAQAALADANPLTTTSRPDLRTATLASATSARFCFDRAIVSVPGIEGFVIGGYRADSLEKSTNAVASGNCVNATFPAADFVNYTYGQVGERAVRAAGNFGNRADSVALANTTSKNGTRGLTTAPDLQGISVVPGAPQQIAFTFDQAVNPSAVFGAGGFHFVTSDGRSCPNVGPACDFASIIASVSATDPNTVIAQFSVGGAPLVTEAARGYVVPGAVSSATAEQTLGTWDSAANTGSSGVVFGVPTLLSTSTTNVSPIPIGGIFLGSAPCPGPPNTAQTQCTIVDYTFNEAVSVNDDGCTKALVPEAGLPATPGSCAAFFAYLSDGSFDHPVALNEPRGTNHDGGTAACPTSACSFGSTTVRAYYASAGLYNEYLVKAGITGAGTTPQLGTTAAAVGPFNSGCSAAQETGPETSPTNTCAVVSTRTGHPNTPGSAPIGGNAGGHATGFTTAPDAFGTTFDSRTKTALVRFDSRVYRDPGMTLAAAANRFQLLDANGNAISGGTTIATCPPSTPGFPGVCPMTTFNAAPAQPAGTSIVWITYPSPAVRLGNAKALEIRGWEGGGAVFGFAVEGGDAFGGQENFAGTGIGPFAADNLQQIVSPSAVAADVHLRASGRWSHKRASASYEKHVLAATKHRHSQKH